MTVHAASIEFHAAVLSTWEWQETTQYMIHHDTAALSAVQSRMGLSQLQSATYVLVDSHEWAEIPLVHGSAEISLDGDHYTIVDNGNPTVHNGHIAAYGSHI